jgi:hypothetical protein
VHVTRSVSQLHVSQVIFLRDPSSNRPGSHTSLAGTAAPHSAQAVSLAHDESGCQLHENCDDCNQDAHAHSHSDHFSWLLDTQALGPKALVPLLLAIVLSVHSFIAGMALGVQEDSAAAVPTLIAIVAHKWVEAISLGVSVVRVTPDRRALLRYAAAAILISFRLPAISSGGDLFLNSVLVIFGAMSPLGIFAGWALEALTTGLLQEVVSAGQSP